MSMAAKDFEFKPFSLAEVLGNVERIKALRAQTADSELESQLKRNNIAGRVSQDIVAKMAKSGVSQDSPEFQAKLDQVSAPYKAYLKSIGFNISDGPTHWDSVQALATIGTMGEKGAKVHGIIQAQNPEDGTISYHSVLDNNTVVPLNLIAPVKNLQQGTIASVGPKGITVQAMPGATEAARELAAAKEGGTQSQRLIPTTIYNPETGDERPAIVQGRQLQGGSEATGIPPGRMYAPSGTITPQLPEDQSQSEQMAQNGRMTYPAFEISYDPSDIKSLMEAKIKADKLPDGKEKQIIASDIAEKIKNFNKPSAPSSAQSVSASIPGMGMSEREKQAMKTEAAIKEKEASANIATESEKRQLENKNAAALQQKQAEQAQEKKVSAENILNLLSTDFEGEKVSDLIKKSTGSGVGAAVDAAGRLIGASSESSRAAAKLKILQGWLTSNVPVMSGPQSNYDVSRYEKMAGAIGDPTIPAAEKMAALNGLLEIMSRYKGQSTAQPTSAEDKKSALEALRKKHGL